MIANRTGEWLLQINTDTKVANTSLQAVLQDPAYLIVSQLVVTEVPSDGLGWTVVVREDIAYRVCPGL